MSTKKPKNVRISSDLLDRLELVAAERGLSVDDVCQDVLAEYMDAYDKQKSNDERRTFPRKQISRQVVIKFDSASDSYCYVGKVKDVSAGGIKVLLGRDCLRTLHFELEGIDFIAVFSPLDGKKMVSFDCKACNAEQTDAGVIINAVFQDAEFEDYQELQKLFFG